jgi:addiction module HigA family antidote
MGRLFNPPHPGEVLRDGVLDGTGITVTEAARQLGVTRAALSRILNGRAGISPDMAVRLGKWLDHSPESWLRMQMDYDLWQAERQPRPSIRPLKRAA